MLSISNLHVSIGDKRILNVLTLDVPAGEANTVMRPNGAIAWYASGKGDRP